MFVALSSLTFKVSCEMAFLVKDVIKADK